MFIDSEEHLMITLFVLTPQHIHVFTNLPFKRFCIVLRDLQMLMPKHLAHCVYRRTVIQRYGGGKGVPRHMIGQPLLNAADIGDLL